MEEKKNQVKRRLLIEDGGFVLVFITFLCSLGALAGWGVKVMVPVALITLVVTIAYLLVVHWIFYFYRPLDDEAKNTFQLYRKGTFFWLKIGMAVLALAGIVASLLGLWLVGVLLFGIGLLVSIGELILVLVLYPEALSEDA